MLILQVQHNIFAIYLDVFSYSLKADRDELFATREKLIILDARRIKMSRASPLRISCAAPNCSPSQPRVAL